MGGISNVSSVVKQGVPSDRFSYLPGAAWRPRRAWLLFIILGATATGCRLCGAENLSEKHFANGKVCFAGFVNWDFHHRRKLRSWKATALVIQRTLEFWYPQVRNCRLVENGTPETFRRFLHSLPEEQDCDFSIVYLASHQSPAGEWDFTQRKSTLLNRLLGGTRIPAHARRIVILDACYAAAVQREAPWQEKFAPISLFASRSSEETPEVNFHNPQPVDFAHRYPGALAWLKDCLGRKWDGKVSFLGFVWIQSFLTVKNCPSDLNGWIGFLQRCQLVAKNFRDDVNRKSSSEITLIVDGKQSLRL
jgi:hypothetical protein